MRNRLAAIGFAFVLGSCANLFQPPHPAFERVAEITEATRIDGAPLQAKRVNDMAEQLVGKTIFVEGFLGSACGEDASADCMRSADRNELVSTGELPPAPGPRTQACPYGSSGADAVLIGGLLPAEYLARGNRRALVRGTLAKRLVEVPLDMPRNSGVTLTALYDYVLEDVSVLALYDSYCEWPRR